MNDFEFSPPLKSDETPSEYAWETGGQPLHALETPSRDRPLDFHWSVDKKAVERADCRATGNDRFDRAMRSIMAALVLSYRANGGWVSYSRRRGWYKDSGRYQGLPYTYANVTRAVAELVRLGLAEEERALPGDHRRTGLQSRVRATLVLVDAFDGVRPDFDPVEVIRLRDENGKSIAYTDTDMTRRRRREIEAINQALTSVRLTLPAECIPRGEEHVEVGGTILRTTPTPVLYRIFSRGLWTKNGRVYWWGQNLPAASRAAMLINGEAVVEIDFAALHPRMLYARCGAILDFDPYDVSGFSRDHAKRALLVGINALSRQSTIGALLDSVDKNGARWPHDREATGALFDAVVERNRAIAGEIGSDAGIDLMHDDSKIAIRIVKRCLAAQIACLPVHDSFIVQARHEDALKCFMDEEIMSYEARMRAPVIDKLNSCNQKKNVICSPTYGDGEWEGVAGDKGVRNSDPARSAPPKAKAALRTSGEATFKRRGGSQKIEASGRTTPVRGPTFDHAEQRRRQAAYLADPSKEYIPTPGESEAILWSVYRGGYAAILDRINAEDARSRTFGKTGDIPPAPTAKERKAGRRLPIEKGGTLSTRGASSRT